MSKFKTGDRVLISSKSKYYNNEHASNPSNVGGTIESIQSGSIYVDWDNQTFNSYSALDLIPYTHEELTKKIKPIKKPKQNKMEKYGGYRLNRNKKTVSFGCGAVKIRRDDLLTLAKQLEDITFKPVIKEFYRLTHKIKFTSNIDPKDLTALASIMLKKKFSSQKEIIDRITKAAHGNRTRAEILAMSPETLRAIAGQ